MKETHNEFMERVVEESKEPFFTEKINDALRENSEGDGK